MTNIEQMKAQAAALVAELFADGRTPMEDFGINWEQAEMLERRNPGIVEKLPPDDGKRFACGAF